MTAQTYRKNALIFIAILAVFTITISSLSDAAGGGVVSTSFIKTLGKTLCLALVAICLLYTSPSPRDS